MARFLALVTAVLAAATIVSGQVTTLSGGNGGGYAEGTPLVVNPTGGTFISTGTILYYVDQANHVVRSVTSAGVDTVLAGVSGSSGSTDGTTTAARFNGPYGICSDGTNLFVADTGNHKMRKVTSAGVVTTIVGTGTAGNSAVTTPASGVWAVAMNAPKGCAFFNTNDLYVAESGSHIITKFTGAGSAGTPAASAIAAGTAGTSGNTASTLNSPSGLCTDATVMYVADTGNNKLALFTPGVTTISAYLGTAVGTAGTASFVDSATFTSVTFNGPTGCITTGTNAAGKVYIADAGNHAIRSAVTSGTTAAATTTIFGAQPTTATSGDSLGTTAVPNTAARFNGPTGICLDQGGTTVLDIFDAGNRKIKLGTIASGALTLKADANLVGTNPTQFFNQPGGICSDATNFYVVDRYNSVIRKIVKTTGVSSVLAGSPGVFSDTDGTGSAARFNYPVACAVPTDANIYVTDGYNNKIRKVTTAGVVTTLVGPAAGTVTAGDSAGTAASNANPTAFLFYPKGITAIGANLIVADSYNHKIKQVTVAAAVTVLVGAAFATTAPVFGDVIDATTTTNVRFLYPAGVCNDGTNLYIVDTGNNKVKKFITPATTVFVGAAATGGTTVTATGDAVSATSTSVSFSAPTDCAWLTGNFLYVADSGNGKIKQIDTASVASSAGGTTTVYSGAAAATSGLGNVDDSTTLANCRYGSGTPVGGNEIRLFIDSATTYAAIFVSDQANNRLRRISQQGTAAGACLPWSAINGFGGYINGNSTVSQYNGATYAVQLGFWLYVSDATNNVVRRVDLNGTSSLWAGTVGAAGDVDGAAGTGKLTTPAGLCTDGTNIYVADAGLNKIKKIDATGALTTLAGAATGTSSASLDTDGAAATARFATPMGIWCNGSYSILIADSANGKIRRVLIGTGAVDTPFGPAAVSLGSGLGDNLGTAATPNVGAKFQNPSGISGYTTGGLLYGVVADKGNNKIKLLNFTSGAVTVLAGPPSAPSTSPATTSGFSDTAPGSFNAPTDLTIDQAGTIYVADSLNHAIRRLTWAGAVTTYVGAITTATSGNVNQAAAASGVYTTARLNTPSGVALNLTTLFVVESGNNDIRSVNASAFVVTTTVTATNTTTTTVTNTTTTTTTAITTTNATNASTTTSSPTTTASSKSSNAIVAAATAVAVAVLAILA